MQLHDVQPKTSRKTSTRVGRGGKRGKTSGKGHKGQKARAGAKLRPEIRDIIKKIPKLRGHGKNRSKSINDSRVKPLAVNLSSIEGAFKAGDTVTGATLLEKGIINLQKGSIPVVKVLGNGELSKALTFTGLKVSASAKDAITKAGGTVN